MTISARPDRPAVGLIGLGHWGPNIARCLSELGALVAVADRDRARLDAVAERYSDVRAFTDAQALIDDPALDAICIATPAITHGALARAALDAGKHVFVEKPLCLDLAEAKALATTAKNRGRVLMVGHLMLYHGGFRALRKMVADGTLGTLRYVYSHRLSLGLIRREESSLWSFAPHDVSMVLALTGTAPSKVNANGSAYLTEGVADTTLTYMSFPGGVNAHIFVSWLHPYKDHRMVVVGSDAMAVLNDSAQGADKLQLYAHKVGWQGDIPVVSKAEGEPVPYDTSEPLRNECEAFLKAIRHEAPPLSDAREAIAVLRVLTACHQAIVEGQPVRLDQETTK